MKLTQEEKQVLTLLNEVRVDGFEEWAQKFINLPKEKLQKIIKKLKALELVDIISLHDGEVLLYVHGKINPDMLDDDLRLKVDFGSDSKLTDFSDKLSNHS